MRRTTLGPVTGGCDAPLDRSLDESRMSFGAAPHGHRKSLVGPSGKTGNAPSTSKKAPTKSRMSLIPGPSFGPDARCVDRHWRAVGRAARTIRAELP